MWLEALTENDLGDRYDLNQSRAVESRDAKPRRKSMKKEIVVYSVECGGDVEKTKA